MSHACHPCIQCSESVDSLNQTTKDSYTRISVHPWVACAMRTKRGSDRHPCAQRTLRRVSQCHVVRFRGTGMAPQAQEYCLTRGHKLLECSPLRKLLEYRLSSDRTP